MPALTLSALPRWLRRGMLALAVLALFAAVLSPAASAQSRSIGTVVIANGWSSADSAVASALAALESDSRSDAVVLYASSDELTARAASFIRDRQPSSLILIGGTAALTTDVEDEVTELAGGATVRRIEGADRFETAANAVPSNATTFIVANGRSAADTGVAAALAATRSNAAVLLAEVDYLTYSTERIIIERQPLQVEFVGGTTVLSAALEDRVRELAPWVSIVPRHAGASRTDTAAAAAPSTSTTLVLANGWSPADMGIAAAYAAVTTGGAVLYSQTSSLTVPTEQRIEELRPRAIVLVGGSAALNPSLHARLRTLAPTAALHRISGSDRIDTSVRAAAGTLTAIGTDPPTAPTSLSATSGNLSLAVSWRAPTSAVGAAVSGYVVQYRACTATPATCTFRPAWGNWTAHAHSGTGTSTAIIGLANDTAYQVRVRARNIFGLGPWSQVASGTPMVQTGRPSVPASVRVEAANEQLKVTWAPSTPPSGAAVDGYDVEYRTCGAGPTCDNWTPHSHSGTATTTIITKLSNGVKHEVRVRSRSGAGQSAWSPTASATPAELPSFERAPDLTPGEREILVRWNEPGYSGSAITDYDVQYRPCTATDDDKADLTCQPDDEATWGRWRDRSHTGTAQMAKITGLVNGTAYEVQVRARNANGVGPWSTAGMATPVSVPARPGGLTVEAGNETLVVTWVAPADNGRDITGYDVQHCTGACAVASTDWTDAGHSGTVARHEIRSLTNGTAYKVRVRAVNSAGDGPWSSPPRSGTPRALPDAPDPPTLTAAERQITAEWTASADNGTTITGYHLRWRACTATPRDCSSTPRWTGWTTRTHTDLDNLEYTIPNRTNAAKHEVQVQARSSVGGGPYSAAASATPLVRPARPATPTLTTGNETLMVTWKAPADNGAVITSYDVAHCVSTADCRVDGDWTETSITGDPLPTTATISSLNNGTTYKVRVRAVNSVGDGPWSSSASGTPSLRPDAPARLSIDPGNGKFGLLWREPGGNGLPITQYIVAYRACTATDSDTAVKSCDTNPTWGNWVERTVGAASNSETIRGLTNGTAYEARVRARTANGVGPWSLSATTTPLAAPSTPTGLALQRGHTQITASWTPSAARGSTISGYIVEYRDCIAARKDCTSRPNWNDEWSPPQTVAAGTTSATIASLTNGTAYQVRVRADSDTGNSGWSQVASAIPAAVPAAPVIETPSPDHRQLRVAWQHPEDRGSTIERYEVEHRACTATDADTAVKTCATNPTWGSPKRHPETGPSLSRIITGLTNGVAYQVRARAQNEHGWGPWTATPAVGTPVGLPSAPTRPSVTTGDAELTVDWIVPRSNGSSITGYDVLYRACVATNDNTMVLTCASIPTWGDPEETRIPSGDSTSTTITGLANGTAYLVRIRATTGDRPSPWSEAAEGMPRGAPDAPTMTLASGNGRLIVTWPKPNARGSNITRLELRFCDDSDTATDCSDYADWTPRTIGSTSTSYTISGLTNGNSHLVEMRTLSQSHGDSDWTSQATATPGGPSGPSAPRLTPGNAQITVTWTAPAKNHSDISSYEVAYCNDTDEDCTAVGAGWATNTPETHTDLSDLSITLTSLTNGKTYRVRVRAQNDQGWGAWSSMPAARPTSA